MRGFDHSENAIIKRGDELPRALQREALASYVHRFTAEHVPAWARKEWKDGKSYPVQYASDAEWLANTYFNLTKRGKLASRDCYSPRPTWPFHPELRETSYPNWKAEVAIDKQR